jgi:pimeloyl-ACP methyl ester carboxylesterase
MQQRMRNTRRSAAAALACLLLAGCEPSINAPSARDDASLLTPCPREGDNVPAVSGAECGYLTVPLQPASQPTGASAVAHEPIKLFIKRWPAISAAPEADPLFVIAGGPGQAASDMADVMARAFFELRKKRDIVFVDQRGTGHSHPLNCDTPDTAPLLQHSAAATAESIEQYRACAQALGPKAALFTTPQAVADLESVRRALGYPRINLWGGSYGTRVVLAYLAAYPSSLRAVVMDGIAPVQLALPRQTGHDATRALALVAKQCLAIPACAERYGDTAQQARQTARQLRASPVTITIDHPLTGLPTSLLLDDHKLAGLVRFSLYDRLASRLLPAALAAGAKQEYRLLASLITRLTADQNQPSIALGMHMTILCNEDAGVSPAPVSERFLGVDLSAPVAEICQFWPQAELPEAYYQPITAAVPALLLSGQRDPVTPPYWAEQVAAHLTRATHLVAPGAHHGVTREGCAADLITEFIEQRRVNSERAACLADIQPLPPYLSPQPTAGEPL